MRVSTGLATAAALAVSVSAAPNVNDVNKSILKGAYIVQFADGHDSADSFYSNLTANGISATKRSTFQKNVFSGVSFRLKGNDQTDLDKIGNFTQVKALTPVRLFDRAVPIGHGINPLAKRVINTQNDTFTTHVMTGVDRLHKEGLDGKGIVIAEIDTGIDYLHPALGGGFGPGFKVAFGYDFVGDAYTGSETPVPDDDPMDCGGHGTHVAGIIGASNDNYVLGVAPAATLGIYKVFGCTGQVSNDVLIDAFTAAFNHGVDLITASIGGASGWPEEPWTLATANIVAAGTPCLLAAGNDGADGLYYASAASAGKDVTSVGSVDNTNSPTATTGAFYEVDGGAQTSFGYSLSKGSFQGVKLPIWATSDPTITNDGCNGFPGVDLTGKVALIRRGTCTFATKAQSAVDAGAEYVLIYNNVQGLTSPDFAAVPLKGGAMVEATTGNTWVGLLNAGHVVTVDFPASDPPVIITTPGAVNTFSGGKMSTFSTWNPDNENNIKPVVSAPGGQILSTYPRAKGAYAILSGTSMATPFTAGVVALYFQAKGKGISPKVINAGLSATAEPLLFNDGSTTSPFLTSVAQQGGGLVNAYKLIHGSIAVTEANLAFNDTQHHVANAAFYVQNTGKTVQTYTLTHTGAATAYAFDADDLSVPATFPIPLDTKYAAVVATPSTLTIKPGEKKRVTVAATPDASLNAAQVPFYSGFINITSDAGESIHLPYGGAATNMHDISILGQDGPWPYLETEKAVGVNGSVATFKPSAGSIPFVYWNNRWATAVVRLDVISVGGPNPVYAAGLNIVGSAENFPLWWNPRGIAGNFYNSTWDGTLNDNTVVKSGTYKFALRFARVFADLNKGREYEKYETEAFYMDMS